MDMTVINILAPVEHKYAGYWHFELLEIPAQKYNYQ